MVLVKDSKLVDISFEDLAEALDADNDFRTSVINHLVERHVSDLTWRFEIAPKAPKK